MHAAGLSPSNQPVPRADEFQLALEAASKIVNGRHDEFGHAEVKTRAISIDRNIVTSGLEQVLTTPLCADPSVHRYVTMLRQHLGNSPEALTIDTLDTAVHNLRYQLIKGLDLSDRTVKEASDEIWDLFRIGAKQPADLDGAKKLEGPEVGQPKRYYTALEARLPEIFAAALPQPESQKFSLAAQIELLDSTLFPADLDEKLQAVRAVDLRRMLRDPRALVPGESEQFYALCTAIRHEISRDTLRGPPIEVKIQNLDRYAGDRSAEETEFFRQLIDRLMTKHGIKLDGLCAALENVEKYVEMDPKLATTVRLLGDSLRHQFTYQKDILSSGEVTSSNLFYIGAITLWRAGKGESAFAGTSLSGLDEAAQHAALAPLAKLALVTGGSEFQKQVGRRIDDFQRESLVREKIRALRRSLEG